MKLFLDNNEIELLDDLSFNIMSLASYGIEYLKDKFVQDCASYELMVAYALVLNRIITGFYDEKYDVSNLKNAKIFNIFKEIRIELLKSENNYAFYNSIRRIDETKTVNRKVNITNLNDKKILEIDDNYLNISTKVIDLYIKLMSKEQQAFSDFYQLFYEFAIDDNYKKNLKLLLINLGEYSKKNSLPEYRKLLNKFQGVIVWFTLLVIHMAW